jgi:cytochrome P450
MTAPLRLEGLSEQVNQALADRLEASTTSEGFDTLAEMALGRWTCVLFTALGIHQRDWLMVSRLADDIRDPQALDALGWQIDVLVAERCGKLADDLLSDLIALEVDGDGFTADELRAIVIALLTA